MIKDEIQKLITKEESENIEFKESFDKETIETIGAFANTAGGTILVGVSDKSEIKGVKLGKDTINHWMNEIAQKTEPRVVPEIKQKEIKNKVVVIIKVAEFPIKPVSVRGRYFKRVGKSTRKIMSQEIAQMHLLSTGMSWDTFSPQNKTLKDIDLNKVKKYITNANAAGRRNIKDTPTEVLKKLELVKDNKATWCAILAFGKEPQRPLLQSAVHCGRFKTDKTQIIDDLMIETDIINQVEEVMKFITRHISVKYEFEGKPKRKEVWEYPLDALREAVINAIVHRDYTASSNVQVEIYDDRIDIWNPGTLLPGITIEDLYKIDHKSVIRNKLIAQLFYDIGYIEKYGSGTIKIIELCRQNGMPNPELKEVFGGFSIVFRKDIYTEECLHNLGLNERQVKAILYVKNKNNIDIKSFKSIVPNVSEKTLYRDLQELIDKGILKEIGEKKGRKYKLS